MIRDTSAWLAFLDVQYQPYPSAQAVLLKSDIGFGFKLTDRTSGMNYVIVLSQDPEINICVDISDSLHFFVLHLY